MEDGVDEGGVQNEPSPLGDVSGSQNSTGGAWTAKRDETGQNAADDSKTDDTDRQSSSPDGVFKRFGTTTSQDKTRAQHSCTTFHPPMGCAATQASHA